MLYRLCRRLRVDLDAAINASTRSFAGGDAVQVRIRRRPTPALLALLRRRLRCVDLDRLAARAAFGEELTRRLPAGYLHPGDGLRRRTHWLYPVLAPDPDALVDALRARGVDVSRGTSNLIAVQSSDGTLPSRPGG